MHDRARGPLAAAAWAVLGAGIALQIAYPLTDGGARARLTVAIVLVLASAAILAAAVGFGPRWALTSGLVAAGLGFAADVVGTATGYPFGGYEYTGGLGPSLLGVPLVIAPAWAMGALPALLAAARLTAGRGRWALGAAAALGLAAWDVFLDPQMVADGRWRWDHPAPHLPGVPGVPLTNFAGWALVAALIGAALAALPRPPGRPSGPGRRVAPGEAQFLWVYASSVLAHAVFLDLPGSALWGAAAMGLVAVPLAVRLAAGARA